MERQVVSGRTDTGWARGLLLPGPIPRRAVRLFSPLLITLLLVFQLLGMPTGLDGRLEEKQ